MSENKKNMLTMTVGDLKAIVEDLPNEMEVIIPVITLNDVNEILAFRRVRTAGILETVYEEKQALCLNGAAAGQDIDTQLKSGSWYNHNVFCERVLW